MTSSSGYLTDTSIFIAAERRSETRAVPEGKARISVVTLTELTIGLKAASDEAAVAVRTRTLEKANRFVALPYDEPVARALADLLFAARRMKRRASMADAIIAATALVHDLTVWTRDDDFEVLAELGSGLRVARA